MENLSSHQTEEMTDPLTALEATDRCLRRLVKRFKEAEEGTPDEQALELDMRRARRQLRMNRDMLSPASGPAR